MKTRLSTLALVLASSLSLSAQIVHNVYQYVLMPDSTFTPYANGSPSGPTEPLAGSFSWYAITPSSSVGSQEFGNADLNFQCPSATLTLGENLGYDSTIKSGPQGQTSLTTDVNWAEAGSDLYFLSGFNQATFHGPASAPTELKMTEGLGILNAPYWSAYLYIHARLIPASPITQYAELASFDGTNGGNYGSKLIRGRDGSFYGTTIGGGTNGIGCIFKLSTSGQLTLLFSFDGANGAYPQGGLTPGEDGNFYGTTEAGGTANAGTIFKVTSKGTLTTLALFDDTTGRTPSSDLVRGRDGNFYGTTLYGGVDDRVLGCGTIFKVTPDGELDTLFFFNGTNGSQPLGSLVLGGDGNLYGTTEYGGDTFNGNGESGWGTIFKLKPNGTLTTLVSFNGTNGCMPSARLTPLAGGFYGTTSAGGVDFEGPRFTGSGTIFKISENGGLTTLHYFTGYPNDGANPLFSQLVEGFNGNLYGTTSKGGLFNDGTIFQLAPSGLLTTLFSFPDGVNIQPDAGLTPTGKLLTFLGTTRFGGSFGQGTVFQFKIIPFLP